MQLYKTETGEYLGFYKEQGGQVVIIGYKDITTESLVTEMVYEKYRLPDTTTTVFIDNPGHWEDKGYWVPATTKSATKVIAGYWDTKKVYVQGHYETQEIWIPAHDVMAFVTVPGHYEDRKEQLKGQYVIIQKSYEGFFVTSVYWQEAHPARGLLGKWVEYEKWVPPGYTELKVWEEGLWITNSVWVEATTEYQTVTIPGQYTDHRVWVDGKYKLEHFWVPPRKEDYLIDVPGFTEMRKVWIPWFIKSMDITVPGEMVKKSHLVTHKVSVTVTVPIFGYKGENDQWDMIEKQHGPVLVLAGPWEGDKLTIRSVETGEVFKVEAKWVGLAERTADNEYVIPVK